MIGRSAILNPAIFNKFKGKDVLLINKIKKNYFDLCQKYEEQDKYYSNFLNALKTQKVD